MMTGDEAREFWTALMHAYADLFITWDEAVTAYRAALTSPKEQTP